MKRKKRVVAREGCELRSERNEDGGRTLVPKVRTGDEPSSLKRKGE